VKLTPQPNRFRYVNQSVGIFVLLAVSIFVAALISSKQVRQWLDPGARLKVILPSNGLFGLSEGAIVEILGTKAGQVHEIVIDPDQQMHAIVRIQSDMEPFVRSDSVAIIRKRFGVAGDSYLEISRGFGAPLDWEYAVIEARADRAPTDNIGDLIDQLRTKIFPVIDDTQEAIRALVSVTKDLQDPQGDFQQLFAHLNTISAKITRGEGVVGRLLFEHQLADDLQQLVDQLKQNMKRLEPILGHTETTVENISQVSAQINAQARDLPQITQSLKQVLIAAQAVMEDLRRTTPQLPQIAENVSEATDSVPMLLLQTQQVMAELEQLLQQLQSHWLLGGKAAEKPPTSTRISPLEVKP